MPDAYSRIWEDFVDDLDAEQLNDLEERMEARVAATGAGSIVTNVLDHGLVNDGTTDNLAAWNTLIAAINAGTYDDIFFPSGTYQLSGAPNAITTSNVSIRGSGMSTLIRQTDATGNFFTFGSTAVNAARIIVEGFYLQCTGSPVGYAISAVDLDDCVFRDIRIQDCQGFIFMGDPDIANTAACSRVHFFNCNGTIKTGSDLSWIRIASGFGCKWVGCELNSGICDSNAQAYVYIGGGDAESDTLLFDDCIFFAQPGGGGTAGIPYGFKIDATAASVNGLWVSNGTFDGTDTKAIYFRGNSSVDTARSFHFIANRFETAAGECIDVVHSNNGANPAQIMDFRENAFFHGNANGTATPVVFDGGQLHGVALAGNHFYEMGTANFSQVISMRCSHWSGTDNHFHANGTADTLNANYIYRTISPSSGGPDPDYFYTGGNVYATPGTAFFLHTAYSGGASTNRRVLETDVTWPGH